MKCPECGNRMITHHGTEVDTVWCQCGFWDILIEHASSFQDGVDSAEARR